MLPAISVPPHAPAPDTPPPFAADAHVRSRLLLLQPKDDQLVSQSIVQSGSCFHVSDILSERRTMSHLERYAVDVVLLDIRDRMTEGFTLVERIRRLQPHCHLLLVSGNLELPAVVKGIRLGVSDLFLPPLDMQNIIASVGKYAGLRTEDREEFERVVVPLIKSHITGPLCPRPLPLLAEARFPTSEPHPSLRAELEQLRAELDRLRRQSEEHAADAARQNRAITILEAERAELEKRLAVALARPASEPKGAGQISADAVLARAAEEAEIILLQARQHADTERRALDLARRQLADREAELAIARQAVETLRKNCDRRDALLTAEAAEFELARERLRADVAAFERRRADPTTS